MVTRLSQFDFRSRLKTWVYRIAVNYILDVKKSPVERMHLTFERFAEDLADGLSSDGPTDAERSLLVRGDAQSRAPRRARPKGPRSASKQSASCFVGRLRASRRRVTGLARWSIVITSAL
jgi:DNA-directed RNA polymerase specialized sigma24 family protein